MFHLINTQADGLNSFGYPELSLRKFANAIDLKK
jgi:hypothetical protein